MLDEAHPEGLPGSRVLVEGLMGSRVLVEGLTGSRVLVEEWSQMTLYVP